MVTFFGLIWRGSLFFFFFISFLSSHVYVCVFECVYVCAYECVYLLETYSPWLSARTPIAASLVRKRRPLSTAAHGSEPVSVISQSSHLTRVRLAIALPSTLVSELSKL